MAVRHYIPRLNGPPHSIESSYLVVIPCRHTFVMLFVSASRQYLVVIPFFLKGEADQTHQLHGARTCIKKLGSPRYGSRHSYVIVPSYLCHDLVAQCSFGV